LDKLGMMLLMV